MSTALLPLVVAEASDELPLVRAMQGHALPHLMIVSPLLGGLTAWDLLT